MINKGFSNLFYKCLHYVTDSTNHPCASRSEDRHNDLGKGIAERGEISRVVPHVTYNHRLLLLNSEASQTFACRKLRVLRYAWAAPGDDGDDLGAHVVDADPAILAEHLDSLRKSFCFGDAIITARGDRANLVQHVVDDDRHGFPALNYPGRD